MPVVNELYGQRLDGPEMDMDVCRNARCQFMDALCDGGGNRDMARVEAHDSSLGHLFAPAVGRETDGWLPCGLCSVRSAKGAVWAICPHRLFAFGPDGVADKHRDLAARVFKLAGFESGEHVSVWSEITLHEKGPSGAFNYRLDYVLRRADAPSPPVIVEVMTCSTSGSKKAKGTDIQTAFKRAVLFAHTPAKEPVRCPTVNARQVWARMASQLIAKSEAANSWGGSTIWIVQDLLADYIRARTALPLNELLSPYWIPDEVNMVVSTLDGEQELYAGPIRPRNGDRRCWMEILGSPHLPSLSSMTKKLEAKPPLTSVIVP